MRERQDVRIRAAFAGLLVFVLLAATAYGLDALARVGGQSLVARGIQRAASVESRPAVTSRGAFFLPQVVAGRYGHVHVVLHGLHQGDLRVDRVTGDLYGVHVPLGDVLGRHVGSIPVDRTDEQLVLTFHDLNAYFARQGPDVTFAHGHGQALQVTGRLSVLGATVALTAEAALKVHDTYLEVTPTRLDTGSSAADALTRTALGQRLHLRIPVSGLPFGQQLTGVQVTADGLVVDAAGRHVTLR